MVLNSFWGVGVEGRGEALLLRRRVGGYSPAFDMLPIFRVTEGKKDRESVKVYYLVLLVIWECC